MLAPSNRARELAAGGARCATAPTRPLIALGPAVPISRRSRIGLPVGVRANLSLALTPGRVRRRPRLRARPAEPFVPRAAGRAARSRSRRFLSPERLGYPPGKAQRERLLTRVDALVATSPEAAHAAAAALPRRLPDRRRGRRHGALPSGDEATRSSSWSGGRRSDRSPAPSLRALRELPDWELVFLRTKSLAGRPTIPAKLRGRARVRTPATGEAARRLLNEAAIFVPALGGLAASALEAAAAGAAIASPPGVHEQPELAAAALARLAENEPLAPRALPARRGEARSARPSPTSRPSSTSSTRGLGARGAAASRRSDRAARRPGVDPRRPPPAHLVVARLRVEVEQLLDHAEAHRARRDRRHRPQRLRRRARGGRARARPRPDRHSRARR